MKNLLLSLLLLLAFSHEALADRGRLNRFGTLTVDTISSVNQITFNGSNNDILFNTDDLTISATTSDGSDTLGVAISAGATATSSRGAYMRLYGNEDSPAGAVQIVSGDAATADIDLTAQDVIRINPSGSTVATFNSGGLQFGLASNSITTSSTDGADDDIMYLSGAGGTSHTRSAYVALFGNEVVGNGGNANLIAGVASGADVTVAAPATNGQVLVQAGGFSTVATFSSTGLTSSEVSVTGAATSGGALCTKADGFIGQCTSLVGAGGTCTCA